MSANPGVARYRKLLAFEEEANRRMFAALESIPESGRKHPDFERALQLLPHNQLARYIWMARLEGRPYEAPKDWFPSWRLEETKMAEAEQNREWGEYLGHLSDPDLQKTISYTTTEGQPLVRLVDDILTHVFNHSTYHRGQLARMVTQCGGQRPKTDFIALVSLSP
jgi:uncharacterized damage-inducible protein DinB